MGIGKTNAFIGKETLLNKVSEYDILNFYLNVKKLPSTIPSPLREDKHPSFYLYESGGSIFFKDFAKNESGHLFKLLSLLWGNISFPKVLKQIEKDILKNSFMYKTFTKAPNTKKNKPIKIKLECKIRPYEQRDIDYWESYGISKKWLDRAEIYPVETIFYTKDDKTALVKADKHAYCFVERKDRKISIKIYQPFNTKGYKWAGNMDSSVWSLWTKLPKTGDKLIIASSMKDCLNIWANTGIPCTCLQGEGYLPKEKIINQLKERFKRIIVFYDNDFSKEENPGRQFSLSLADKFHLDRVEIPEEYNAKDPSDLYKLYGKEKYLSIIKPLIQ